VHTVLGAGGQYLDMKAVENPLNECPTSCLSSASRQEMSQNVSFFRDLEILATCLAGKRSLSQEFSQ
jgi:hypothetical protein